MTSVVRCDGCNKIRTPHVARSQKWGKVSVSENFSGKPLLDFDVCSAECLVTVALETQTIASRKEIYP